MSENSETIVAGTIEGNLLTWGEASNQNKNWLDASCTTGNTEVLQCGEISTSSV